MDEQTFVRLYRDNAPKVLAYALRRVPQDEASDVVAETFLIAWRRQDILPSEPLSWLYRVAYNVVLTNRRSTRKADELLERIHFQRPQGVPDPGNDVTARISIDSAMDRLTEPERECLRLVAWEQLDNSMAAKVVGCSCATFAVRLHRARKRLHRELFESEKGRSYQRVPEEA